MDIIINPKVFLIFASIIEATKVTNLQKKSSLIKLPYEFSVQGILAMVKCRLPDGNFHTYAEILGVIVTPIEIGRNYVIEQPVTEIIKRMRQNPDLTEYITDENKIKSHIIEKDDKAMQLFYFQAHTHPEMPTQSVTPSDTDIKTREQLSNYLPRVVTMIFQEDMLKTFKNVAFVKPQFFIQEEASFDLIPINPEASLYIVDKNITCVQTFPIQIYQGFPTRYFITEDKYGTKIVDSIFIEDIEKVNFIPEVYLDAFEYSFYVSPEGVVYSPEEILKGGLLEEIETYTHTGITVPFNKNHGQEEVLSTLDAVISTERIALEPIINFKEYPKDPVTGTKGIKYYVKTVTPEDFNTIIQELLIEYCLLVKVEDFSFSKFAEHLLTFATIEIPASLPTVPPINFDTKKLQSITINLEAFANNGES